MTSNDSDGEPRLVAVPRIAALRAGRDETVDLWVRLIAPHPAAARPSRFGAAAGLRAVRLYLRPSAGVSATMLDGHPRTDAPTGELGWLLPDLPPGGEVDALLRLRVDRGLAVPDRPAPLLWLRAAGLGSVGEPRAVNGRALVLPALPPEAYIGVPPDAAVQRRMIGQASVDQVSGQVGEPFTRRVERAGPVDTCGRC